MLGRIFITILIFYLFMFIYLRYYEKKAIYFPEKAIEFTPADIGLEHEDIYFNTVCQEPCQSFYEFTIYKVVKLLII